MAETARPATAEQGSTERDPAVREWVARAQAGDAHAFEQLYRLHVGMVYGICLRFVADPVQAEALTQDAFVRAWQKLDRYAGRGAFGGWLRRLAINVVMEDRRVEARHARWRDLKDPAPAGMGSASSPVSVSLDLERAIAALPRGARAAFVMHDVYGYRHREAAALMGVAEGTVKAQLHRARRLLRQALRAGPEGPRP